MAVLFDSSTQFGDAVTGGSGSVSGPHVVNALATDRVAIVAVMWIGNSDTSSGSLSVTFGGASMTGSTPMRWTSNKTMFQLFTLANPGTGSKTVQATAASMGGNGYLIVASSTYSGVQSIGSIVSVAGSTATTSNTISVSSASAAYRVVTVHGCGAQSAANSFSDYNLTQRAYAEVYLWPQVVCEMILGDGPGAATVTGTATQKSSAAWGAYGIPLTPSVVLGDASLNISMNVSSGGNIYRANQPSPLRYWVVS